jgi:carboxypeptidase Q
MKKKLPLFICAVLVPIVLLAQEKVDLSVVNKIKTEAFGPNSKVMDYEFQLSDVFGAHISDSPVYYKAADWAIKTLKEMGLADARLEKWGTFGRSWAYTHFAMQMVEPHAQTIIGAPQAWSPGTNGPVTGEVVMAPINTEADMDKYRGQLKGKFIIQTDPSEIALRLTPDAHRYTDQELAEMALAAAPRRPGMFGPQRPGQRQAGPPMNRQQMMALRQKITEFLKAEGVAGVIQNGRGDFGTFFTGSAGSRDMKQPIPPVTVVIGAEYYNQLARLIEHKVPVKVQLDVKADFYDNANQNGDGNNIVADLPGSGPHKDEVVIIGAHFDTWHAATGSTDDVSGTSVMMEVMRILTSLKLPLDRTVRICLWDAEEQGLLGSAGYVKNHFADPTDMVLKPEHAKVAAYFNHDNGGGKLRGIYTQGNDMVDPIFEAWIQPWKEYGVTTVTNRNTSGTDHLSFDAVGLPGFQFIQDPMDYGTRTHHTNMDLYDRIQPNDMQQAAAVIASFVYNAATRPEMLPRKPLPKPRPARQFGM